jgi:integrase
MKYIKSYNESIKHLLKPKKDEDFKKVFNSLPPNKKIFTIRKYDMWDILPKEEIQEIRNEVNKNLQKIINEYVDKYNNSFFKDFLKKYPTQESFEDKLHKDYYTYNEEEDIWDYCYHQYDLLKDEFNNLPDEYDDISGIFEEIWDNFHLDLCDNGW